MFETESNISTYFLKSSSLPESELLLPSDDLILNIGDIGGTSIGAASARISLGDASGASNNDVHLYSFDKNWSRKSPPKNYKQFI